MTIKYYASTTTSIDMTVYVKQKFYLIFSVTVAKVTRES